MSEEKVGCRTPAEGRDGVTNIPKWKYDLLRAAILDAVGEDGIAFEDLIEAVRSRLSEDDLDRLGSLGWHATTVKLNMEVEQEISRVPGVSPQQLVIT